MFQTLAAKPENQTLIPETYRMEKSTLTRYPLNSTYAPTHKVKMEDI